MSHSIELGDNQLLGAATRRRNSWPRLFTPIAVFLGIFGTMNFAELPLGWKDRTEQISHYLDATVGLSPGWAIPALWAIKSVELTLGMIAFAALAQRKDSLLRAAVLGWLGMFTGFAAMDVWAADRAELQEHTVYFVMLMMLLTSMHLVSTLASMARSGEHT